MSRREYKKGAASFYVVAFSTLILLIIVTSFTALVIAQITRSSNADLSQSAYDSALAGVEDAKLAYYNYQSCLAKGASAKQPNANDPLDCDEIVYVMENDDSCDKVAYILGREIYGAPDGGSEVLIQESEADSNGIGGGNNMSQAYTCAKIQTVLKDYRSTLSSSNQMKVVKVKLDGVSAKDIKTMRISWGADLGQSQLIYSNFDSNGVSFGSVGMGLAPANPPTIAVTLIQARKDFKLSEFDTSVGNATNRGTVFLVPTDNETQAAKSNAPTNEAVVENYIRAYADGVNKISVDDFTKSNNRVSQNKPYGVYCSRENAMSSEFVCSAVLELPGAVGGDRDDDNFLVAVTLPYGKPVTDFALEFFCAEGASSCGTATGDGGETNQASLKGMQIGVDATGRANDLFRRVETRLEGDGDYSLSMMGPLELFGDGPNNNGGTALDKNLSVICEANFPNSTYPGNGCTNN
ncbi:hypothetical protein IJG22_00610 [Candidatus Saccharibacteria bacterium]|nr:hypothetical protein [Candidatus Saccharibacteria bacterium]